jgi:hypothetical protein
MMIHWLPGTAWPMYTYTHRHQDRQRDTDINTTGGGGGGGAAATVLTGSMPGTVFSPTFGKAVMSSLIQFLNLRPPAATQRRARRSERRESCDRELWQRGGGV